ncbi:alpha/beta-hydrolase [Paraphaeosphaeria sporulosa]|uniref:Alpha/beta-hydrolase n=1 Tax=Paraphaeosphaeria sporulosa TaxID=1460663 RepID=A0A177CZ68_9PLEO|nr:alpha/beta-hydrolase [Paraphaeosphaeria sporulosa]OAG12441.1 alpha/beta-hydrolase [Paraphaeosphaeria sporulosa]
MATPLHPFRVVYKTTSDGLEIDADVYLPTLPLTVITIHGGAFMLGSSRMVNEDQIRDCLSREWVVVSPNHRLCPQVDLLEGPMQDCRDLLAWIYEGKLEQALKKSGKESALDMDRVYAMGTSSGGTLALSLGFDVPKPAAAIYSMYGASNFSDPFWTTPLPHVAAKLPPTLDDTFLNRVFNGPVPITGGVSLEGQAVGPPDFKDPRQAYALTRIARGKVLDAIFPSKDWDKVDPLRNVSENFPPTFIVHGGADTMVPVDLSKALFARLKECGVRCGMVVVEGEEHTFAAKMKVGSRTWEMQREGFEFLEGVVGRGD